LNAYAKSPFADKAFKANALLNEMECHSRMDCRPDTISYNTLLEACSNAFGDRGIKDHSVQIALQAFKTLIVKAQKHNTGKVPLDTSTFLLSPTSTTFALWAKVCRRLLATPEQKRSALTKTLQICRDWGMLNHLVVRQVQTCCQSETEWKETVGELAEYVDWKADFRKCRNVPKEWTCHERR
jgi:hypothetical protein